MIDYKHIKCIFMQQIHRVGVQAVDAFLQSLQLLHMHLTVVFLFGKNTFRRMVYVSKNF